MANELDSVSKHLAQNIESLRKKRQLTQAQLSRQAGLPRSTLTYLESGEGNPSLLNLVKIAGALQVSIEELLAAPRASYTLVKAEDVVTSVRGQGGVRVFNLLPDPIPGMHFDRMELEAGARMPGVPHVNGTKEYMLCLTGEITVKLAAGTFRVGKGDVFAFPGDQPHSYQNSGNGKAVGVSVVVIAPAGL